MNTLLPVTAGEIENYSNSTLNKLCHKNERVFFSIYQYTANAPVLSGIEDSQARSQGRAP